MSSVKGADGASNLHVPDSVTLSEVESDVKSENPVGDAGHTMHNIPQYAKDALNYTTDNFLHCTEDTPNNTHNLPQCVEDQRVQIKIDREDDSVDIQSSAECKSVYTESSLVAESNKVIKKKEDLSVVEEVVKTQVDDHLNASVDDQETSKSADKSFHAPTPCNEAIGSFIRGLCEEGSSKSLSVRTKELSESQNNEVSASKPRSGVKEKLTCKYCRHKAKTKSDLKLHFKTHPGKKPFSCMYCQAKFRSSNHLRYHMRSHFSYEPYRCIHCLFETRKKHHLTLHLRSHTGDKPFSCSHCSAKFARNSVLKLHLLSHTGFQGRIQKIVQGANPENQTP